MRKSPSTPGQIIGVLDEVDAGGKIGEACRLMVGG
jgi:hypothetical protein